MTRFNIVVEKFKTPKGCEVCEINSHPHGCYVCELPSGTECGGDTALRIIEIKKDCMHPNWTEAGTDPNTWAKLARCDDCGEIFVR